MLGNRISSSSSLKRVLSYSKFASKKLTVLMLGGEYLLKKECIFALEQLGHRVHVVRFNHSNSHLQIKSLLTGLVESKPDFILSVNHRHFDADGQLGGLLEDLGIPIAVWYVDNPLFNIKKNPFPAPRMTSMFLWEHTLIPKVKQAFNIDDVHYLPLATTPEWFHPRGVKPTRQTVFVGDSMQFAAKKWRAKITPELFETAGIIAAEMEHAGRVDGQVLIDSSRIQHGDSATRFDTVTAATWLATSNYRKKLLSSVVDIGLVVHGDPGWQRVLPEARYKGKVAYGKDLSKVFERAQINLNATSFQMQTAVNQRVFDVPASGGFILTDDLADLHDHFEVGREVIVYKNPSHLVELVEFYRKNDSKRREIVKRARIRVLEHHTYVHRIQSMLEILRKRHEGSDSSESIGHTEMSS